MTKYVIDTVELIKKQYVVEAYTERAATELMGEQAPDVVEVLSDTIYNIHTINEYEYNQKWKPQPDYNEGYDLIKKLDPDLGPDQLKDNLDWIDKASGREGNGK